MLQELFISVDIETAGSVAPKYSLLSIGACLCERPDVTFYAELKPINDNVDPEAMAVHGLDFETLKRTGLQPRVAMMQFADWVMALSGSGYRPIMTGLAIAFDWGFLSWYFAEFYDGANPFGHCPVDVKSMYMGATGCSWDATRSSQIDVALQPRRQGNHHPVVDAQYQAELFQIIRARYPVKA